MTVTVETRDAQGNYHWEHFNDGDITYNLAIAARYVSVITRMGHTVVSLNYPR